MSEYKKQIAIGSALVIIVALGLGLVASPYFAKASSASSTGSSNSQLVTLTETMYCFTGSSVNGSYYCSNSNTVMKGFTVYNETTITTTANPFPMGGPPRVIQSSLPSESSVSSHTTTSDTFFWAAGLIGLLSVLVAFLSLSRYSPIRLRTSKLRVGQLFHARKKIVENQTFTTSSN